MLDSICDAIELNELVSVVEDVELNELDCLIYDIEQLIGVPGVYFNVLGSVRELWCAMRLWRYGWTLDDNGDDLIFKLGQSSDVYNRFHTTLPMDYRIFYEEEYRMEFYFARPLCRPDLHHDCDKQLIQRIMYHLGEVPFKTALDGSLFELKIGCKSFCEVGCIPRERLPWVEKQLRGLPDDVFGNHQIDEFCRKVIPVRKRYRHPSTPDQPPQKRVAKEKQPIAPFTPPPPPTRAAPPPPRPEAMGSVEPAECLPLDDDRRCHYKNTSCKRQRAVKTNGKMHSLCDYHRAKANYYQRKMYTRRRIGRCPRVEITESGSEKIGEKIVMGEAVFTVW